MASLAAQQSNFVPPPETSALRGAIFKLSEKENLLNSLSVEVTSTSVTEIWAAIRNAVDEIALPKELALYVDGTPALRLSISRRSLTSLRSISESDDLLDQTSCTAGDFAKRIHSTCAGGRSFALTTTGRSRLPDEPGPRCSGQQLEDALNADMSRPCPSDPLEILRSLALATILFDADGKEQEASGSETLLHTLRMLAASLDNAKHKTAARHLAGDQLPQPTCLIVPFRDELSIAETELNNKRMLFVIANAQLESSSFHRVFQRENSDH